MFQNKKWLRIAISAVFLFAALRCFAYGFLMEGIVCCMIPVWLLLFPKITSTGAMNKKEFCAIGFMLVPCLLSFKSYPHLSDIGMLWWRKNAVDYPGIKPGFLSLFFAIVLYASLFAKRFISLPKRLYDYLILLCDILFLGSLITVFLSEKEVSFLGITITEQTLAIFAIIMSYIGIKVVAGFVWIALLVWGLSRMAELNTAMDGAAIPYILCAFVSILLQVQDEVKLRKMLNDGFALGKQGMKQVGGDVAASGKVVQETARTIASVTGSAVGAIVAAKQNRPVKSEAEKNDNYIDNRIVPTETGLPTDILQP